MIYSIRLTITHHYHQAAANSRHLIRVLPKTIPHRQRLMSHALNISPEPDTKAHSVDFFENAVTSCAHFDPHSEMSIQLACHIQMAPSTAWKDQSPNVTRLRHELNACVDLAAESPLHFLGPTPRLSPDTAITEFANDVFDPKASTSANVIAIGQALHTTMTFDANATTVDTDAPEAFRSKRGVCQDFSHIMIIALQVLGIPSAYVSGYLRTLPPMGGVKLEGADAMHAWVRAWCGAQQGWIEYDPTNATLVGTSHVVFGYGRDYSDVSPVKGHLRTWGGQRNSQAVDVTIVD